MIEYPCDQEDCHTRNKGSCNFRTCKKYLDWFADEWNGIRRAAEMIRIEKEERERRARAKEEI